MQKYYLILSIVFSLCSCTSSRESKNIDVALETIDISTLEKKDFSEIPADIIKNKKYICLSADNKDLLFSQISRLKLHNDRLYILDERLKKLLVYAPDGTPICKIGTKGHGPGEYVNISDFDIDNNGNIYIYDGTADKFHQYDSLGQFVASLNTPFEVDILRCLPDGNFLFGLSSWNEGEYKGEKVIVADKDMHPLQKQLQYDEFIDDNFWFSNYQFITSSQSILYNRPIDNRVYQFSMAGKPTKIYNFDFGNQNVPDEAKTNIESKLKQYDNYCFLKKFVVITPNHILGTLHDKHESKTFLIDRHKKTIYKNEKCTMTDITNPIGYSGNTVINCMIPGAYSQETITKMALPANVKTHLTNGNFVLCLYELQ